MEEKILPGWFQSGSVIQADNSCGVGHRAWNG